MFKKAKGFTLLELLIVLTIIAILSVIVILVLNPVETLKKARDSQRISDLATIKTALGIFLTTKVSPTLGNAGANTTCKDNATTYSSGDKIWYSLPSSSAISDTALDGGTISIPSANQVVTPSLITGSGWIPVNLSTLIGGSPISNYPVDPVNTITTLSDVSASDLVYRYTCDANNVTFEVNANLESQFFTTSSDNKEANDGGNNSSLFEVGTDLTLLGTGADF